MIVSRSVWVSVEVVWDEIGKSLRRKASEEESPLLGAEPDEGKRQALSGLLKNVPSISFLSTLLGDSRRWFCSRYTCSLFPQ